MSTQSSSLDAVSTAATESTSPIFSDLDLYLFGEGTHMRIWEKMGAHIATVPDSSGALVTGVYFAVWAPQANYVSVVGDFNQWDPRRHAMAHRSGGVWDIFVPDVVPGALYKYYIESDTTYYSTLKSDPYGFFAEVRPRTASIVYDLAGYDWSDESWVSDRARRQTLQSPVSVYEVHLGSWRHIPEEDDRLLTYQELATTLVPYVKEMGYTHIELLPITEHPFDGSWGYQTTGYFAPTSRFGTPHDFMAFVDAAHQAGIGVILDWVPSHFTKDGHGLGYFDGTHVYEHADSRIGEHLEWGTYVFNYGRNEVRNFLIANALFWLEVFHLDGLRVDAVASMIYLDYYREPGQWLPNKYGGRDNLEAIDFLCEMNRQIQSHIPGALTIAEESSAWPRVSYPVDEGGLGFNLKWDMGWMNDTLRYMAKEPIHRRFHQGLLTFSFHYAFSEHFMLPLSHDEVVHLKHSMLDKMPGDVWQRFANLRALYTYMYAHPGKKLLFMGGEFGQWREWNDASSLDWHLLSAESDEKHRQLQTLVRDLNRLYEALPALHRHDCHPAGFAWIDGTDEAQSVIAFLRMGDDDDSTTDPRIETPDHFVVTVCNFTPVPRHNYRIGVPADGLYREILNSDNATYGGSGVSNGDAVAAEHHPFHGFPFSVSLTLPPLAVVLLAPR